MLTSEENPNFLKDYFASSRLHHLSLWKRELVDQIKKKLKEMKKSKNNENMEIELNNDTNKSNNNNNNNHQRIIAHIDIDAFFVSASLLLYPHLKEKPG
jgi:DNA repair protein REV1